MAAWVVLAAGCGAPPPTAPSAVVELEPDAVCMGDGFRTPIALDGTASAPRLTLAPGPTDPDAPPLRFEWRLSGADWILLGGDLRSDQLRVATDGDRPLHVSLTVRDGEGGSATALETVWLTVPDPALGGCPE